MRNVFGSCRLRGRGRVGVRNGLGSWWLGGRRGGVGLRNGFGGWWGQETARRGEDATPIGADVDKVGHVARARQDETINGAEALLGLEVHPCGAEVGAAVDPPALGPVPGGVQVPTAAGGALAERNLAGVGDGGGEEGKAPARVGAAENAQIGGDKDMAGLGGVGDDVADDSGVQEATGGAEGVACIGRLVEGFLGAGVEDVGVLFVAGDVGTGGEAADAGEGRSILGPLYAQLGRRPQHRAGIGREGDGAAGEGGISGGMHLPGDAAVRADGQHLLAVGVAHPDDIGDALAGVVDADTARPLGIHPCLLRRLAEIALRFEGESVIVVGGDKELGAAGGTGETLDGHFLDTIGQGLDGDVDALVPVGQIVTSINGHAGAVKPMVGVEGVNFEALDHPAKIFLVDVKEAGLDPWSLRPPRQLLTFCRVRFAQVDLLPWPHFGYSSKLSLGSSPSARSSSRSFPNQSIGRAGHPATSCSGKPQSACQPSGRQHSSHLRAGQWNFLVVKAQLGRRLDSPYPKYRSEPLTGLMSFQVPAVISYRHTPPSPPS